MGVSGEPENQGPQRRRAARGVSSPHARSRPRATSNRRANPPASHRGDRSTRSRKVRWWCASWSRSMASWTARARCRQERTALMIGVSRSKLPMRWS